MGYAIIAVIILILDQGVKYWINIKLDWYETANFIPKLVELHKVPNKGAAFGFLKDVNWFSPFIIVFSVLISAVIIFCIVQKIIKGRFGCISAIFVLAGAMGNSIDRMITGITDGYVTDMFRFVFFPSFPVFNVADMFLVIGGIMFGIYFIMDTEEPPSKSRTPSGRRPQGGRQESAQGENVLQLPVNQERVQERTKAQEGQISGRVAKPRPANQPDSYERKLPSQQNKPATQRPARAVQSDDEMQPEARAPQRSQTPARGQQQQQDRQQPPPVSREQPRRRQSIEVESPEYNLDDILAEFAGDDD